MTDPIPGEPIPEPQPEPQPEPGPVKIETIPVPQKPYDPRESS